MYVYFELSTVCAWEMIAIKEYLGDYYNFSEVFLIPQNNFGHKYDKMQLHRE